MSNKFVALIQGHGEGCDYTIACGKDFKVLENSSIEAVQKWAKEYLEEQGTDRIKDITIFNVLGVVEIDSQKAILDRKKQEEKELIERRIQDHEDAANELKAKLGRLK